MVLAASDAEHTVVEPLLPPEGARAGERCSLLPSPPEGGDGGGSATYPELAAPATANVVEKKKYWEAVQPGLATGPDRAVTWRGARLGVAGGALTAPALVGARVA